MKDEKKDEHWLVKANELEFQEGLTILRPIRVHFLINIQDKELEEAWNENKAKALSGLREEILSKSGLSEFFERVKSTDYTEPGTPEGWNEVKIIFTKPRFVKYTTSSEIVSLYIDILERLTEWMKSSSKVECRLCYFEPLTQLYKKDGLTYGDPKNMVSFSVLEPVVENAWELIDDELDEFKSTDWFKENYQQKET